MIQGENILFIDMEWEQKGVRPSISDRIVEIAAKKLDTKSKFFRWIKNSKPIRKQTCKFLNVNQSQIDGGVCIEKAMIDLNNYAIDTSQIVVWSQDTRIKLIELIEKYKCNKMYKNIIALQDVFSEIVESANNVSFEAALISMKATYNQKCMHNAGFDVRCLKDLFIKITSEYEKNNIVLQRDLFCVKNNSKVYHVNDCCYLRKSNSEKILFSYKDVIGRTPCKRCIGTLKAINVEIKKNAEINKIKEIENYKGKAVSNEMMYEIAKHFGLGISGSLNIATVSTGYSYWQVYCDRRGYVRKLKHENYFTRKRIVNGFHEHQKFPRDIYSLFEYIYLHDQKSDIKPIADEIERRQKIKEKKKRLQKSRKMIEYDEWEKYYDVR